MTQTRTQKGVPSGGQFAAGLHDEAYGVDIEAVTGGFVGADGRPSERAFRLSEITAGRIDSDRVIAPPRSAEFDVGESHDWADATTQDRLAYLDGYASAAEGVQASREVAEQNGRIWWSSVVRDRGSELVGFDDVDDDDRRSFNGWRRAGFQRAIETERALDLSHTGPDPRTHLVSTGRPDQPQYRQVVDMGRSPGDRHQFEGTAIEDDGKPIAVLRFDAGDYITALRPD